MSKIQRKAVTTMPRDDVPGIRELTEAWITAVRAKDLERLLSMLADDVVFLSASLGPIRGKDKVAALYRDSFAKYNIEQISEFEEIQVTGDWAYAWGPDALTLTPRDGGALVRRRGYGLSILQRETGGAWRYRLGINNMVQVSPPDQSQP